jgi:hypothetical protein
MQSTQSTSTLLGEKLLDQAADHLRRTTSQAEWLRIRFQFGMMGRRRLKPGFPSHYGILYQIPTKFHVSFVIKTGKTM